MPWLHGDLQLVAGCGAARGRTEKQAGLAIALRPYSKDDGACALCKQVGSDGREPRPRRATFRPWKMTRPGQSAVQWKVSNPWQRAPATKEPPLPLLGAK